MTKREIYRAERAKGRTFQSIADEFKVSRQCVWEAQAVRWKPITDKEVVYPNLKKWMDERHMTKAKLARSLGYDYKHGYTKIRDTLSGAQVAKKPLIDKLIALTGIPYEILFAEEEK